VLRRWRVRQPRHLEKNVLEGGTMPIFEYRCLHTARRPPRVALWAKPQAGAAVHQAPAGPRGVAARGNNTNRGETEKGARWVVKWQR
jgi:hypothetical protein